MKEIIWVFFPQYLNIFVTKNKLELEWMQNSGSELSAILKQIIEAYKRENFPKSILKGLIPISGKLQLSGFLLLP